MKLFACMLSFYIIALTAIPCIDVPIDHASQKVELSQNATDNHHDNTGHCSPFCACYCCVSPIINQQHIIQFNSFSFSEKHLPGHTPAYVSLPFSAIWQPPKIS